MLYRWVIRPCLFLFQPEQAHRLALGLLNLLLRVPGMKTLCRRLFSTSSDPIYLAGLKFLNPVGLAAGFDKDARFLQVWETLGFGFVEVGTVTPRPQPGNPKPRLFRLPADEALINRLGFNNQGVDAMVKQLKNYHGPLIIGGNIGKNKDTDNDLAEEDYIKCFTALFPYVHFFVVNVSSPNTPGLRALQEKEPLQKLLASLQKLNQSQDHPKPLFLKIAPDLNENQLADIVEIVQATDLTGLVATNTTTSRTNLVTSAKRIQNIGAGGLSGSPVYNPSNLVLNYLKTHLPQKIIIGVGGILHPGQAAEKIKQGADLVEIYTGFIYNGPFLPKRINKYLYQSRTKYL